jgi:putative heme iron utilization protein
MQLEQRGAAVVLTTAAKVTFVSQKYKAREQYKPYFVTATVTHCIDLFTREEYRQIILDSLLTFTPNKSLYP